MKRKHNVPAKSALAIAADWAEICALSDYRERVKRLRGITFDIKNSYQKGLFTAEELDLFSQILASAGDTNRSFSAPLLASKIIQESLSLKGVTEPEVISKINGTIQLYYPRIWILDQDSLANIDQSVPLTLFERELVTIMNQGNFYLFETGVEGLTNVQVRVVTGNEPLLSKKEHLYARAAGSSFYLHLPSGRLIVTGVPLGCEPPVASIPEGLQYTVEPGWYRLKVFCFYIPKKVESYYIVLCKVEGPQPNQLIAIDFLDPLGT